LSGTNDLLNQDLQPVTGRPQGENIDDYSPETRDRLHIPPGMTNAEFRADHRRMMAERGLPPVGHVSELTDEEMDRLMRIVDFDLCRSYLDLPCDPWHLPKGFHEPCTAWFGQVRCGKMTREEYHRKVLEMAGLPPAEQSSSGQTAEAPAPSGEPAEEDCPDFCVSKNGTVPFAG